MSQTFVELVQVGSGVLKQLFNLLGLLFRQTELLADRRALPPPQFRTPTAPFGTSPPRLRLLRDTLRRPTGSGRAWMGARQRCKAQHESPRRERATPGDHD